jgi:hypothetical protein
MRNRRVLLCLPETPSEDVMALARAVKAALSVNYQVRLRLADEAFDDDVTPVDTPHNQPLVVTIKEPSDDGERTM